MTTTVYRSRFDDLGYQQIERGLWRIVVVGDGTNAAVGPQYRSKAELLADLPRYAREVWGLAV
jgi:hypothetical protein